MLQNSRIGEDSSQVWENCPLKISKNSNFGENGKFGNNFSKVWQKLKQDNKRRMSLIVGFYENAIKGLAQFKWATKTGIRAVIRKWQI